MAIGQYRLEKNGWLTTAEETAWLRLVEQHGWSEVRFSDKARLWLELQRVVRVFLDSLVNGRSSCSRRSGSFWLGILNGSARYWRYGLEPRTLDICRTLDIKIPTSLGKAMNLGQLREFLARTEHVLTDVPADIPTIPQNAKLSGDFDGSVYDRPPVNHLTNLMNRVRDCGIPDLSLYLHGSMATLDYTAFSDVDDLVVLGSGCWNTDRELQRSADLLTTTARGYQKVDPLQHHGHFVITKYDLDCYDQSLMPLAALTTGKAVSGPREFPVMVRDSRKEFREILWGTIQGIRALHAEGHKRGLTLYWLKHLAGKIALIPALLLQSRGDESDKPDAIASARNFFGAEAYHALTWSTQARETWPNASSHMITRWTQRTGLGLPPRRHYAEAVVARLLPRLDTRDSLMPSEKTWESILRLSDDSAKTLGELVAHDCG